MCVCVCVCVCVHTHTNCFTQPASSFTLKIRPTFIYTFSPEMYQLTAPLSLADVSFHTEHKAHLLPICYSYKSEEVS
jgi:hypothetical protein